MITAVDTNILVALWDSDSNTNTSAQEALDQASSIGKLVVSAPVFAELLASPGRDQDFLERFCADTEIAIDWEINRKTWIAAGQAFQSYVARRRAQHAAGARRILADFLIGAHACENADQLLTLDKEIYQAAFPTLRLKYF